MAASSPPTLAACNAATLAHLNMVQGVINRVAGNSAQCKTWCLTLVTALIAFAGAIHNIGPITLAILPIVMFFLLDAAYLATEIAYRNLFNTLAKAIRDSTYNLDQAFDLRAPVTSGDFGQALCSWSIGICYYPLIVAYVVVMRDTDLAQKLAALKT